MCTSFDSIIDVENIIKAFQKAVNISLIKSSKGIPSKQKHIRPTDEVLIIHKVGDEYCLDIMRWGFKLQTGPMVNSRLEEITAGKNAEYWQSLLDANPCLFVMSGYNEWKSAEIDMFTPKGKPTKKKVKQPFKFTIKNKETFFCAGYFRKEGIDNACTLITTVGNDVTRLVHEKNRMPVILEIDAGIKFLNGTLEEKIALCQSYPSDNMDSTPTTLL